MLQVIIDQLGSLESTYDDFLSVMPENQCRYGSECHAGMPLLLARYAC